jgi:DNA uptake protein ComE-like DNA-binding protein
VAIEEQPAEAILTGGGPVSLSSATFDDLRELGLSVTQAKRILDFRDRLGGFDSVEDLDYVPGFPRSLLGELKSRVTL